MDTPPKTDAAPAQAEGGKKPSAVVDFINNMDARAWRAVWVTLIMFVVVGAMLVVGRLYFGDQIEHSVRAWLGSAERGHWGLPAAIAAFTIAAFIGAPQGRGLGIGRQAPPAPRTDTG